MKKRLRKKKHFGEFSQYGVYVNFPCEYKGDDVVDIMTTLAEKHGLRVWGGGNSYFSMAHFDNMNEIIPDRLAKQIIEIAITGIPNEMRFFFTADGKGVKFSDEFMSDLNLVLEQFSDKAVIDDKYNLWR